MEVLGENLANVRRKRTSPPPISMLVNVTLQCLQGLFALHQAGIVHSDVKPSNFAFRAHDSDYSVVTLDFGLSQFADENPEITQFRAALKRNPRYLSLHTHQTTVWDSKDDRLALIYTISDFWKDELPWDGRTTDNLVLEVKNGYDFHQLLPPELHFYIDLIDAPEEEIISRLEELLGRLDRDVDAEMRYIFAPADPDRQPKFVKYVFEEEPRKRGKHQLSA
jgi:tau tubulin kinase